MALDDIPLMSMIRGKLGYLNQRQKLIAENVANADTPGYSPRDLKAFTFAQHLNGLAPVSAERTQTAHISVDKPPPDPFKPEVTPNSETKLDGNQVVLEEEMMKMNSAQMDYSTAVGLYEESLSMLQMAARKPGGS